MDCAHSKTKTIWDGKKWRVKECLKCGETFKDLNLFGLMRKPYWNCTKHGKAYHPSTCEECLGKLREFKSIEGVEELYNKSIRLVFLK